MDFDNIPYDLYDEVLAVVEKHFPGSRPVIGGGAIRDAIHNRPIKDVDVFVRAQDFPHGLDSPFTTKIRTPPLAQHYGRADMHGAWDLVESVSGYDVQIIAADFDNLYDLAGTFDIGLSRATYDGRDLYLHPHFVEDSRDLTLRIRRGDNRYEVERSLKRIARLKQKYPEFTHIVTATEAIALGLLKLSDEPDLEAA